MNSKTALEKKYEIIKQNLGNQTTFYTDEVIPLFPELKKSTLYWNLSKLVEAGYIKRVRNGVFSFNDLKGRQGIILCETAQKLKNYMDELGFIIIYPVWIFGKIYVTHTRTISCHCIY